MRLVQREKLPLRNLLVAEAGNGVASERRLYRFCKIETVITVQSVAVADNVTDIDAPLIIVNVSRRRADKARSCGRIDEVRTRYEFDEPRDHAGGGPALGVTEDEAVQIHILREAKAFVRRKEKRLTASDRAAQIRSELIAFEGRRLAGSKGEEIARIERVVTQELEEFAVKLAGARTCSEVEHCSRTLSVFRAEG